ncbi:unnamed protein product [Calicophoron daubneyi]|uniref:UspA domain-containing protein n=1 Tax=Calicophoron daubneyi TaxID=300641 RepID=A0AAV2SZG9_CALDB
MDTEDKTEERRPDVFPQKSGHVDTEDKTEERFPDVFPQKSGRVILFPVDGSVHSDRAYSWYLANMKRENDVLKFINVVEPIYNTPSIGMAMETPPLPDMSQVMEESIAAGKALCQKCMERAKESSLQSEAFLHVDNKPGQAIVEAIKKHQAEVIIMGNRGIGALRPLTHWSKTEKWLNNYDNMVVIKSVDVRFAWSELSRSKCSLRSLYRFGVSYECMFDISLR